MHPFLIDTHSHVNFNAYINDGDEVIRRALDKKIWMINVGSQLDTSRRAVELASQYKYGLYAAIGLHPIHLFETRVDEGEVSFNSRAESFDSSKYQSMIENDVLSKIVAVGEIGLDYYHEPRESLDPESFKYKNNKTDGGWKQVQKKALKQQLKFAYDNKLPVILHCRGSKDDPLGAYNDLFDIIKSYSSECLRGVVHCFGGNVEIAQRFIDMGFYVGFTGIITFGRNADLVREVVKAIPLDKILVETDCPYLAPNPYRGKRNEPSYVEFVARKVAEIKGVSLEEVASKTTESAIKLFQFDFN